MGARKGLTVDTETFYLAVALKCGPPTMHDFTYSTATWNNMTVQGIPWWVHNAPKGHEFLALVQQYGEAKMRASHWYIKYAQWYLKTRANYHQPTGIVDSHTVLRAAAKWSAIPEERANARKEIKHLQENHATHRRKSSRSASQR